MLPDDSARGQDLRPWRGPPLQCEALIDPGNPEGRTTGSSRANMYDVRARARTIGGFSFPDSRPSTRGLRDQLPGRRRRRVMSFSAERDTVRGCISDASISWVPLRPWSTPEPDLGSADRPNRLQTATSRIVAFGPDLALRHHDSGPRRGGPRRVEVSRFQEDVPVLSPSGQVRRSGALPVPCVEDVGVRGVVTTGSPACGDHLMTKEDGSEEPLRLSLRLLPGRSTPPSVARRMRPGSRPRLPVP
jgi:hypothetical protein